MNIAIAPRQLLRLICALVCTAATAGAGVTGLEAQSMTSVPGTQKLDADYFPITEPVITGPATRVMSLKDASKKMSKSDASPAASVLLMDDEDTISKKFKRATTDADALPSEEKGLEGRAEADNLVGIYAALSDTTKAEVLKQFGGQGWGVFKPALADLAVTKLAPLAGEVRRMMADPAYIDGFMADGAQRAGVIADVTMREVRRIVGFLG